MKEAGGNPYAGLPHHESRNRHNFVFNHSSRDKNVHEVMA